VAGIIVFVLAHRVVEEREQEDDGAIGFAVVGEELQPGLGDGAPVLVAVEIGRVER